MCSLFRDVYTLCKMFLNRRLTKRETQWSLQIQARVWRFPNQSPLGQSIGHVVFFKIRVLYLCTDCLLKTAHIFKSVTLCVCVLSSVLEEIHCGNMSTLCSRTSDSHKYSSLWQYLWGIILKDYSIKSVVLLVFLFRPCKTSNPHSTWNPYVCF